MPQIRNYLSQSGTSTGSALTASPDAFGAGIGRGVQQVGAAIGEVANEVEEIKARSDKRRATDYVGNELTNIQLESQQQLLDITNNAEDPEEIAPAMEKFLEERTALALDNSPNELAKQVMQQRALDFKLKFQGQANKIQATQVDAKFKNNAVQSIDNITNSVTLDPDNFADYKTQAMQIMSGAKQYMTPAQSQAFVINGVDQLYSARMNAAITGDLGTAKQLLESDEYKQNLKSGTFERLNTKIATEEIRRKKAAVAASQRTIKLLTDNPSQLARENGAETAEDIIAWERNNGITERNLSIIPKAEAQLLATQFNGVTNSDEMLAQLQKISQLYPDPEHYNVAMRDLNKNGLSRQASFMTMMGAVDKDVMTATFKMSQEGDNFKKIASARGVTSKDISTAVENEIEDVRDVLLREGKEVSDLNEKLNSIATYFVATGADAGDAAEQATQWLTNKSPLAKPNGNAIRLPVDRDGSPIYEPDKIESGLEVLLKRLTVDDIAQTTGTGEFDLAAEKDNARFVLNNNEDSYYMVNSVGTAVTDKSGQVILYPVESVILAAEGRLSEKEQKIFEENLKKLQSGDF